jgi:hypothetical protein
MFGAHRYIAAALFATSVAFVAPACASYGYTYRDRGYVRPDIDRVAFETGYHEGLEHGQLDAVDRRSYSYQRHGEFRNADEGYRRDYGDRRFYQQQYRAGFERGYDESYRRYAGRRSDRY